MSITFREIAMGSIVWAVVTTTTTTLKTAKTTKTTTTSQQKMIRNCLRAKNNNYKIYNSQPQKKCWLWNKKYLPDVAHWNNLMLFSNWYATLYENDC